MFRSWSQGWELIKASWGILQKNRQLLAFPLLSLIGAAVITGIFGAALVVAQLTTGVFDQVARGSNSLTTGQQAAGFGILFLYYLAMAIVTIYANVALTSAVLRGLAGQTATVRDGFAGANARLGNIFGYAVISATVGLLLALLRRVASGEGGIAELLTRFVAGFAGLAWGIATFLVIPVLVVENISPIAGIKRSAKLLQQTWGSQLIGNFSIGGILMLALLALGVVIGGVTFSIYSVTNASIVLVAGVALFAIAVILLTLIQGAMMSIFRASLYHYANTGNALYFPQSTLQGAFQQRQARIFGR